MCWVNGVFIVTVRNLSYRCTTPVRMAVATFEANEAAASVVFTTLASVKNNYFDQFNFKYESHESRFYCCNSQS